MDIQDLDPRKMKIATGLKWALGLLGALIIAPVIFLIVKGLVGLALAAIVGLAVVNFMPVLSMKMANWKWKLIVAEAQKNPIETMYEELADDRNARAESDQEITAYETEINNIESNMTSLTTDLQPEDIETFRREIAAMREDLALMQIDLTQFDAEILKKDVEVRRSKAIWQMNMVIDSANKRYNTRLAEATMKKIKTQTAIDAVSRSSAAARAQLNQRIRNRKAGTMPTATVAALAHQPPDLIAIGHPALVADLVETKGRRS